MTKRTKPTVGDVVQFVSDDAAFYWGHSTKDKFLVEEVGDNDYSLLGHEKLGTKGYGFAWVYREDLEIVRHVDDETLDWLDEAENEAEEENYEE